MSCTKGNKINCRYYVSIEACLKEVEPELCLAWLESKKKKKVEMCIHSFRLKRGLGFWKETGFGVKEEEERGHRIRIARATTLHASFLRCAPAQGCAQTISVLGRRERNRD